MLLFILYYFQMRRLKFRKLSEFAQGHRASQWQKQYLRLCSLYSESAAYTVLQTWCTFLLKKYVVLDDSYFQTCLRWLIYLFIVLKHAILRHEINPPKRESLLSILSIC